VIRHVRNKTELPAFDNRALKICPVVPMSRLALVVDDDPAVLELIAGKLGCEVITRQDAAAALAALEQDQRIEILLTDINMPGGLRTREPGEAAATTGEADPGIRT